jgi:hypothetical protein
MHYFVPVCLLLHPSFSFFIHDIFACLTNPINPVFLIHGLLMMTFFVGQVIEEAEELAETHMVVVKQLKDRIEGR